MEILIIISFLIIIGYIIVIIQQHSQIKKLRQQLEQSQMINLKLYNLNIKNIYNNQLLINLITEQLQKHN